MARKLRVEYPGAIYHVMNRGDRREAIFKDDADRKRFLETLAEACGKTEPAWLIDSSSPIECCVHEGHAYKPPTVKALYTAKPQPVGAT